MCQRGLYKWLDRFRGGRTSVVISDTERITAATVFITQPKIFYCDGIRKVGDSAIKCSEKLGDDVQKQYMC
jgi:hypothetical protein